MQKTYNIETFGCQMNERDSETLAGMLEQMGYVYAEDRDSADIVIMNTCSVREHADKRFFGTLGQLKKIKEAREDFIVCLCGCMMQQAYIIETIREKYSWVDIIFGTQNIDAFPRLLKEKITTQKKQIEIIDTCGKPPEIVEGLPAHRMYSHKGFVNIMYGCNNFCTYCIVPYTRGRERSRNVSAILDEIRELALSGAKEVTLLGQNVNSYMGEDENGANCDFAGLLYKIADVEGIERIRFMTSHPKDLSDRLVLAYRDINKLSSHIHLPVQSGSDAVLKRMNRHYDAKKYLELVRKIREARPDIAITTDIIVGFPGETEEDFEDTLKLCREVVFDSAFTFIYSVRPGTPAANYEDQIPEEIKHERFERLVETVNAGSVVKNAAMVGKVVDVLVDGYSARNENMLTGRTSGFKLINFPGPESAIGNVVKVLVTESKTFSLEGQIFLAR